MKRKVNIVLFYLIMAISLLGFISCILNSEYKNAFVILYLTVLCYQTAKL